jgi:hypothetical protein
MGPVEEFGGRRRVGKVTFGALEMSGLDRQRIADGFAAQTEAFVRDDFQVL